MNQHRFRDTFNRISTPEPVLATTCGGFVACPLLLGHYGMMTQAMMIQQVYALALEQAQAVAKPSRLERLQNIFAN